MGAAEIPGIDRVPLVMRAAEAAGQAVAAPTRIARGSSKTMHVGPARPAAPRAIRVVSAAPSRLADAAAMRFDPIVAALRSLLVVHVEETGMYPQKSRSFLIVARKA